MTPTSNAPMYAEAAKQAVEAPCRPGLIVEGRRRGSDLPLAQRCVR